MQQLFRYADLWCSDDPVPPLIFQGLEVHVDSLSFTRDVVFLTIAISLLVSKNDEVIYYYYNLFPPSILELIVLNVVVYIQSLCAFRGEIFVWDSLAFILFYSMYVYTIFWVDRLNQRHRAKVYK